MIKFFRHIRKDLMETGKTGKYFKYAIGEIVLVVIGILIALSINNWNEERKSKKMATEIYTNLVTSLRQDSIQVQQTIEYVSTSLEVQRKIILSDSNQYMKGLNQIDLDKLVQDINLGVMSFFPKTGVYDLITSNNSMDLLQSKKIKPLLINLYDFQYKRYENVDAIIDHKYHYMLRPITQKKIGFIAEFNFDSKFQIIKSADSILFREHYKELVSECRDMYSILSSGEKNLFLIKESINELLPLIKEELK